MGHEKSKVSNLVEVEMASCRSSMGGDVEGFISGIVSLVVVPGNVSLDKALYVQ